jgi:hypothetical protein
LCFYSSYGATRYAIKRIVKPVKKDQEGSTVQYADEDQEIFDVADLTLYTNVLALPIIALY